MQTFFKHSLSVDVITVRQDNDESKFIETNAGVYYPLIKINGLTVSFADVISCDFTIGRDFAPLLTVVVTDSSYQIRQNNIEREKSFITVFIGNPNDEVYEPIKQTYLITDISSEPGSANVNIDATLYAPKLFEYKQSAFTGTSFDCLKSVAEYAGLGFVSNVSNSNDSMTWLSPGKLIDWIKNVADHAYIADDDSILCFIDQYANLNYISLLTSFAASDKITIETNVLTGEALEEPVNMVLTTNKLETDTQLRIAYYTPLNNYGEFALQRSTDLSYAQLNSAYNEETTLTDIIGANQVGDVKYSTTAKSVNTHDKYNAAPVISAHNRHLMQGTKLSLQLDCFAPSACLFMSAPVEIYTVAAKTARTESDDQQSLYDLDDNPPTTESNAHVLQESLSGDAIITEMSYRFVKRSIQSTDSEFRIQQYLKVFLKN
jgi:hypothetical protein